MTNIDLQSTTQKTKDRATWNPLKTGGELMRSGRVRSFCSTCCTCHVTFVTNPMISNKFLHDVWNYYCYSSLTFLTVNLNSSMMTLCQVSQRTSSCLLVAAASCLLHALWQSQNTGHVLTSISKYEFRIWLLSYRRVIPCNDNIRSYLDLWEGYLGRDRHDNWIYNYLCHQLITNKVVSSNPAHAKVYSI